jgi:phosphohistidine phosphatase SixA
MTPSAPAPAPLARARRALIAAAAVWCTASFPVASVAAQATNAAPPALVLVVRHAEKVDNSDDPALSGIGTARAEALAEALSDARVEHVIVTQRQRTRLTAAPLMSARGLEPEVVPFGRDMAEHVRAVAAAVRRQSGKVVLVVGHSNTVPMIVHALGGPRAPDLCDARYAALFAVVPGAEGTPAGVVVSSFGVPDPPTALTCAGMVPR